MKVTVMERQDYQVKFETLGEHTVIHCDVYRYTREIKKQLLADLRLLLSIRESPLIAVLEGGVKHLKFLKMMGFEKLIIAECTDGIGREIYIIDPI